MKKREFLIIFLSAVLGTGLSWFAPELFLHPVVPMCRNLMFKRGWPLAFYCKGLKGYPPIGQPEVVRADWGTWFGVPRQELSLSVDFLFWFLVSASIWFLFKRIRRRGGEGNV